MRCKVFNVPLEPEAALDHERRLNDFLTSSNVKRVFASLANQPQGPLWSVMFFYEDVAPAARPYPANAERASAPSTAMNGAQTTPQPAVSQEAAVAPSTPLTGEQIKSIVALKKWRAEQAAQEGVPLYMVAQNRWLEDIVQMPVRTVDDLVKVKGLGQWRVQKYGIKIVEVLSAASAAKRSWPTSSYSAGRA
jgi:superfamily II DNA helicase RecQ